MASGIARGRVCTMATMTTESRNMAAKDLQPWFIVDFFEIDTCQNKVSADQYHVTILRAQLYSSSKSCVFLKFIADQVLVFNWIAGSCQVNLLKTGQDCLEGS